MSEIVNERKLLKLCTSLVFSVTEREIQYGSAFLQQNDLQIIIPYTKCQDQVKILHKQQHSLQNLSNSLTKVAPNLE